MEVSGKSTFDKPGVLVFLLCCLHLFLGIGALWGGTMLVLAPDGSKLGMELTWLNHAPFTSFLIPGIILFVFMGVLPMLTCYGLLYKPDWVWANLLNIYRGKHWSWAFSLYAGIIVILWIVFQQVWTGYFWLQPVMIGTGLLIMIISLIPSVMNEFERFQ